MKTLTPYALTWSSYHGDKLKEICISSFSWAKRYVGQ